MIKTLAFILSASLAACAGQAEVRYSGSTTDPELVAMDTDPDVMVVSNADEPVFYSDKSYWLYRDQRWYRSDSYRGGWAREDRPPEHVRRIERPEVYVHFRHGSNPPRTTSNEGDRGGDRSMAAPRPELREPRREQTPPGPVREPNPEGPTRPYPNPLPPQQVPPVSPRPDTERPPSTPEAQEHARDQRPVNDKADRRDDKRDDNRDFGRSEEKH
jgi:hypothetical protein